MIATSCTMAPGIGSSARLAAPFGHFQGAGTLPVVQTRYLLLASVITLFAILAASAVWFLMAG